MEASIYFYSFVTDSSGLDEHAREIGPLAYWTTNAAKLVISDGYPDQWLEQGAVFNSDSELRWWKRSDSYQVVLITNQPNSNLTPIPGRWQADDAEVFLQNLTEPRVRPQFDTYPHGTAGGVCRIRIYRRDGVTVWVSPRAFLPEHQEVVS